MTINGHLLVLVVLLGVIFFAVEKFVDMSPPFAWLFRVLCVILAIGLLLQALGFNTGIHFSL